MISAPSLPQLVLNKEKERERKGAHIKSFVRIIWIYFLPAFLPSLFIFILIVSWFPYFLDSSLAFWMVHEVRQPEPFLQEIYSALKMGGRFLVVEPKIHVPNDAFNKTVRLAEGLGFTVKDRLPVIFSRAALMQKIPG